MSEEKRGTCLCGAVTLIARKPDNEVRACHCAMCRKWGGGPFVEIGCGSEVSFEGIEHMKAYVSSPWAERGFCSQCGTHLFYRLKDQSMYMVPAGLFEDPGDVTFNMEIFIDEKPAYYSFAEQTDKMTCKEVFEKFSGS